MRIGPDGKRFVWGHIVDVHEIGRYQIVEAVPNRPRGEDKSAFNQREFFVYVDNEDVNSYATSLDQALLIAIAAGNGGKNEAATTARYMARLAGVDL